MGFFVDLQFETVKWEFYLSETLIWNFSIELCYFYDKFDIWVLDVSKFMFRGAIC